MHTTAQACVGPLLPSALPLLPLSRTLDPTDYDRLGWELILVDQCDGDAQQASHHRRWEYALALHAIRSWALQGTIVDPRDPPADQLVLDVGGGGSTFGTMVRLLGAFAPEVIDPHLNSTLEFYAEFRGERPDAAVVTAISVLEHLPRWKPFLKAAATVLAPGGLLFLTMDYWDAHGPDTAHFHWMRKRIFDADLVQDLIAEARKLGLKRFGGWDGVYHGNQVYGEYTFHSLALMKAPEVAHD